MAYSRQVIMGVLMAAALCACKSNKATTYTSDCAAGVAFKQVNFTHLIDSIKYYDKQFVEVTGRYLEDKHVSALVNDRTFTDHGNSHALWINFTQDCPLYQSNTHRGLFETEDGEYRKINNKLMTLHGRIDVHKKGNGQSYSATLDEVSYVQLH